MQNLQLAIMNFVLLILMIGFILLAQEYNSLKKRMDNCEDRWIENVIKKDNT